MIRRIYNRETGLTNDKIEELVGYTNDADSLVMQIQKAEGRDAKKLVPFCNWINELMIVCKQPFYRGIVIHYSDLVTDIVQRMEMTLQLYC